ncbi:hypothetical protein PENFLA_c062G03238 [Penicillium flavigenum]|uniref:Uncharacterized protein n=1 Tax=Penicillium flavigenum TaxID=254877 RepID=A0A1V6SFZ8_9EURO|nr:hypothetical protein PENFLA_c062G03238 [Penicillium flavigenum]
MSSTPAICSTIYSLDSAKSTRLLSDALGYIVYQQIRQCL